VLSQVDALFESYDKDGGGSLDLSTSLTLTLSQTFDNCLGMPVTISSHPSPVTVSLALPSRRRVRGGDAVAMRCVVADELKTTLKKLIDAAQQQQITIKKLQQERDALRKVALKQQKELAAAQREEAAEARAQAQVEAEAARAAEAAAVERKRAAKEAAAAKAAAKAEEQAAFEAKIAARRQSSNTVLDLS
jgi:glutamyl/glutaminyl-tRNA synthetase